MRLHELIPLMLGSGLAGALLQRLLDYFLSERARRRSQRTELGNVAAQAVGQVLESIVLLVRERSARIGSSVLDSETWEKLKGDLCNKIVRHVQLIPDSHVREELRIMDICLGNASTIAARLPDESTRDGYLRSDGNVCVDLAVEGLLIVGRYLRGERARPSEKLTSCWAVLEAHWEERSAQDPAAA
jgi:hypothetical protein